MSSVKYRLLRNAAMCVLRVILSKLEEQCETQKCFPANRMTPSAVQQQCTEVKAEIHLTVRVPLTKGWLAQGELAAGRDTAISINTAVRN